MQCNNSFLVKTHLQICYREIEDRIDATSFVFFLVLFLFLFFFLSIIAPRHVYGVSIVFAADLQKQEVACNQLKHSRKKDQISIEVF